MTQSDAPIDPNNADLDRSVRVDDDAVRRLADILNDTDLSEIEYETDAVRIRVVRKSGAAPVFSAPVAAPAAAPAMVVDSAPASDAAPRADADHPGAVTSPMVGTVYLAPEPGVPNFAAVGDSVQAGQTLMLVEAMKTFNEIKAPKAGVVKEICVENGVPIEYGEVLAIIE